MSTKTTFAGTTMDLGVVAIAPNTFVSSGGQIASGTWVVGNVNLCTNAGYGADSGVSEPSGFGFDVYAEGTDIGSKAIPSGITQASGGFNIGGDVYKSDRAKAEAALPLGAVVLSDIVYSYDPKNAVDTNAVPSSQIGMDVLSDTGFAPIDPQ